MSAELEEEEFSLTALSRLLLRHKVLIAAAAILFALVAGIMAFRTPPYFRAEVTVTDVRDRGFGNVSSLATQLGGLASLAGVNLPTGGGASTQESAAVLESHHLAEEFIKRNELMPLLLRGSSRPPTLWLAVKRFKDGVLTIRKDQRRGVTTVDMVWTDAATAARWANQYVALANELIRGRALEDASRNIAYLNEQIAQTNAVDMRKVMYNLVESETKNLMVAKGRVEYAFEVVDPAVPPELKAGPHRLLNSLMGFIIGFAFGALLAFVIERVARFRRQSVALLE